MSDATPESSPSTQGPVIDSSIDTGGDSVEASVEEVEAEVALTEGP